MGSGDAGRSGRRDRSLECRAATIVWIALDEWEEELFRRKLPGADAGALDWPPVVDAGTDPRTRVWRLRDRDRFMRGETIHTDRLQLRRSQVAAAHAAGSQEPPLQGAQGTFEDSADFIGFATFGDFAPLVTRVAC